MKTIDPHSLFTNTPKKIESSEVITKLYSIWKELFNQKSDSEINNFDCFLAGYFFGINSNLREKYLKSKTEEKFDNRISNIL